MARDDRAKKGGGPSGVREGRLEAVVRGATVYNSCRRPRANRPCPQLPQSCLNLTCSHGYVGRSSVVRGSAERIWVTRSRPTTNAARFLHRRGSRSLSSWPREWPAGRHGEAGKSGNGSFGSPIVYPPCDSARVP